MSGPHFVHPLRPEEKIEVVVREGEEYLKTCKGFIEMVDMINRKIMYNEYGEEMKWSMDPNRPVEVAVECYREWGLIAMNCLEGTFKTNVGGASVLFNWVPELDSHVHYWRCNIYFLKV